MVIMFMKLLFQETLVVIMNINLLMVMIGVMMSNFQEIVLMQIKIEYLA